MPASHDLKGLMKFLARDEWRGCFEQVFDNHFGPVLEAGDMEFDDLAEILSDDWAMTLWGCAFEDFLTQEFDVDGGNIVDEYLKRRGWKEGAQTKVYMKALRTSVMSLYEVSDIVPGKSLTARDLIRGGEPIAVSEGTATQTLKQWDRIAARIVPVLGKNIFAGGLLPYTPQATDALFDGLRQMFGKKGTKKLPALADQDLQSVASMFTLSWLFDTLDRAMALPPMQNSDGDDLMFHDIRFPLATGVTQKDIAAQVNAIPGMAQENVKFWNWLEDKPKGREKAKHADALSFDATMDNGLRVLGNVELKGRFLHLSTNSAARAEKGTALIRQALGDIVGTPLTEIRTIEQMMAERPPRERGEAASNVPPEIAEQVVHQFMDRQYRETLDQPVGMLGNKTPRQTVKSAAGRQKVAEWLKYLENQSANQPNPADPMATYNFAWMWKELGVHDLRR
ncbi:hypothetical protein [Allomesorhizobium alhagi]|uniref:Antitoxin Xre/MbcA/ParS-like toxin-binding domain-containing protein n=1 Tax=Mesorhizobium alhagi CCNWXJ12-2 TaxID=1107882 RepID=H0I0T8_9HYPH|nr:hypothetical protein [Mesorhizobium alhagi]EHK53410.1 hypothetical protein MAXJ12_30377 [Mesorhizobium alhagi CCNWXJ12-2]